MEDGTYTIDEIDELQRALLFQLSLGGQPFYYQVEQRKLDQEHIELRATRRRDYMVDTFRFRVAPQQSMIDIPGAPTLSGWANIVKGVMTGSITTDGRAERDELARAHQHEENARIGNLPGSRGE